ncbi:MAG: DUF3089 domain-containing protein [Acidaminococcaceae bacterium]
MRSKRFNLWRLVVLLCCSFSLCWNALAATPYEQNEYWAVLPAQHSELQAVDVFFVCPMVDKGFNMSFADEESKAKFVGAIKMEQGIYDANCNFFAPFYRQMGPAIVYRHRRARLISSLHIAMFERLLSIIYNIKTQDVHLF